MGKRLEFSYVCIGHKPEHACGKGRDLVGKGVLGTPRLLDSTGKQSTAANSASGPPPGPDTCGLAAAF